MKNTEKKHQEKRTLYVPHEYYPDLQGLKSSDTALIKVAKLGKCCYDQILKDEKKLQYLYDWFKDNRGSLKATCYAHCLNPRQNYFMTSA